MRARMAKRLRYVVLAAMAAGAISAAVPGAAGAKTVWLCKPGKTPNPCRESLATTVVTSAGASHVERPRNARNPKFDCFYVYPTVSEDSSRNADKSIDPELVSIAEYQASRFSRHCRVFTPVYRQLTLDTLFSSTPPTTAEALLAYSDVRAAWLTYLRRFNRGRGVVLIGHSQGTGMLRHLIRQLVDDRPRVRKRLLSAILLGGDVTVRAGKKVNGDFNHIPACVRRRQLGCVIAFSAYNETPPSDSFFGRPESSIGNAFGLPTGPGYRVLCTNPAALGGGTAPLQTLIRTEQFAGDTLAAGIFLMYNGPPPTASTPWLVPQDHYTGKCVNSNGADVLFIDEIGAAEHLTPSPDPTWGLHLADANIALGNLVSLSKAQSNAYLRRIRLQQRR